MKVVLIGPFKKIDEDNKKSVLEETKTAAVALEKTIADLGTKKAEVVISVVHPSADYSPLARLARDVTNIDYLTDPNLVMKLAEEYPENAKEIMEDNKALYSHMKEIGKILGKRRKLYKKYKDGKKQLKEKTNLQSKNG